jgi:hypothetical protein
MTEQVLSDVLAPLESKALRGDYRVYFETKRENFRASINNLPLLWDCFQLLDEIWIRDPQAPADSCGRLQSWARHAPPDRQRHAARVAGSPADHYRHAFLARGRYPPLARRDFRMLPTHCRCPLVCVTYHHYRQLLSRNHLHHGLLTK